LKDKLKAFLMTAESVVNEIAEENNREEAEFLAECKTEAASRKNATGEGLANQTT
jgi:hypothetical protein